MAAIIKSPFQIGDLIRSGDDGTKGSHCESIAATPPFVLAPFEPLPAFALGAAQKISTSNGQSAELEPKSGSQHIPRFDPSQPVLRVPSIGQQRFRFQKLQEYEGEVISLTESDFVARLVDLTDIDAPRLEATFANYEVSPSDESLLRQGAIFYWIIGSADYPTGQRKTENFLRFRRLPIWSKRDIQRLEARADELEAFLQSDD